MDQLIQILTQAHQNEPIRILDKLIDTATSIDKIKQVEQTIPYITEQLQVQVKQKNDLIQYLSQLNFGDTIEQINIQRLQLDEKYFNELKVEHQINDEYNVMFQELTEKLGKLDVIGQKYQVENAKVVEEIEKLKKQYQEKLKSLQFMEKMKEEAKIQMRELLDLM